MERHHTARHAERRRAQGSANHQAARHYTEDQCQSRQGCRASICSPGSTLVVIKCVEGIRGVCDK